MDEIAKVMQDMKSVSGILTDLLSFNNSECNLEQMRLEAANQITGPLSGLNCPVCRNRGYTFYISNGSLVTRECQCMTKRRGLLRIERSGLKDVLDCYTFENYQTLYDWQKQAKMKALNYVVENDGKWFCALGAVGSGKSHLCTAICCKFLDAGLDVRYMLWRDESRLIKAVVGDSEEYERLIKPLKDIKVLYIDDFFKTGERVTSADINLAFEILNARYNRKNLITIISSELTISQILDIDEAVGSRLLEKSKGFCLSFIGEDKNWRLR